MALAASTSMAQASANPQVGLMVGSDNGVSIRHHDLQFGVGINRLSFSVDKTYFFKSNPNFYWGGGAKLQDHHSKQLAARAVFGASTKVEDFVFFAELKPSVYLVNKASVDLEANIGVRYQF
ncbi:hypothetical protein GCM10007895_08890 [Paraferrimonas sedimenticola]|uniref:Uncharacterized protein n=2 Tax=Paraferrimonas sedimenticola TaxID=375674 RepID=A0AA37RUR9_9GAMM|nr:hypothetical protein GCM10007895_08890 [Paraferrimonas sedimenticola]